jgi:DNA mismatch repair protein MutS2
VFTLLNQVHHTLEFHKIKELLLPFASSSIGKEMVENLQPSNDLSEVEERQQRTDEAVSVLRIKENVPLGGIRNIRSSLKRAEIGGMLNTTELQEISSTIRGGRRIKRFIDDLVADKYDLPILEHLVKQIELCEKIENEIEG